MPINANFKSDLLFLNNLNPKKDSVIFNANNKLELKRISFARKFFNWFIHILSCTRIPVNADLDRVTRHILAEASKYDFKTKLTDVSEEEKKLLKNALENLDTIIKKNGGEEGKKVKILLETVEKIKTLDAVQNLKPTKPTSAEKPVPPIKNELEKPIPPLAVSNDTRLQELIQRQKPNRSEEVIQAAQELAHLLPQLEGSVALSPEDHFILYHRLNNIEESWITQNAKKLHPNLIRFFAEKCLQTSQLGFIFNLFVELIKEPLNKENLAAFIRGFPVFDENVRPKGDYYTRVKNEPRIKEYWLFSHLIQKKIVSPDTIIAFEKNLSPEDFSHFIRSFFGHIALSHQFYSDQRIEILDIVDKFDSENRKKVLQILCQCLYAPVLTQIINKSNPEDNIIETILRLNPAEEEDERDSFFNELLWGFKNDIYPQALLKIAEYVLKNEADVRKIALIKRTMQVELIIPYLKYIPQKTLINMQSVQFMEIVSAASKDKEAREILARAWNEREDYDFLFRDNLEILKLFLPILSDKIQIHFLRSAIRDIGTAYAEKDSKLLESEEAWNLPLNIWEEASNKAESIKYKTYFTTLPPKQSAALINGQIKNNSFCSMFFGEFFGKKDSKNQWELMQHLKPQVFNLKDPQFHAKEEQWKRFFQVLSENLPNEHAKELLISSTLHLFNHEHFMPDRMNYFYLLTKEQLKLLPIDKYKPEISLLIASETGLLDIPNAEFLQRIVTDLTLEQEQKFLLFFANTYKNTPQVLIDFIIGLSKLDPQPILLSACVEKIGGYEISTEKRKGLVSSLPKHLLAMFLPHVHRLAHPQLFELITSLSPKEARRLLDNQAVWHEISNRADPCPYDLVLDIPMALIVQMVDDSQKLKELLTALNATNLVMEGKIPYFIPIIRYLERHPWKLFLLLDNPTFYWSLNNFIKNKDFPTCEEIFKKWEYQLTQEYREQIEQKLQKLFELCEDNKFTEARKIYDDLENVHDLLEYKGSPEELFTDLSYMHKGQIYMAMLTSNQKFQEAIKFHGVQNDLKGKGLSDETFNDIETIQDAMARLDLIEKILNEKLAVACVPKQDQPTVQIDFSTEEGVLYNQFDLESLKKISPFFTSKFSANWKQEPLQIFHEIINKASYNHLVTFLNTGNVSLKLCKEEDLINLYTISRFTDIQRLSALIVNEIILRVIKNTWQNVDLFTEENVQGLLNDCLQSVG